MYQQAVLQLTGAAAAVDVYRANLATMAGGLEGKHWGAEVHGTIREMDCHLHSAAGIYRELAAQMSREGDVVADAHDRAPWVPDSLCEDLYPDTRAGGASMAAHPGNDQPQVPDEARDAQCPRCGTRMVPTEDVQANEATGEALVVLVCGNPACEGRGGWSWRLPAAEYQTIFGHCLADGKENDEQEPEQEMYTHCWGCDQLLEKPTPEYGKAYHVDCDPDTPPKYWMGALTANRKKINHNQAEGYCRLQDLAADAFDSVLEWETPLGDTFISFPDGSIVDAREWIERPENIELAGGRDRYAGCGEFDPAAPDRCWLGQTLPSGRIARPGARSFDDVAELATAVCRSVFEDRWGIDRDRPYLAMLPGGEFVDALDWAQLPDTRRLAGCTTVRNRVRFRATDTCPTCRAEVSTVCTRIVQGEIGEECFATAAIRCDACDVRLSRGVFIPIILVDDASAITGAPPRVIGDAD